MLWPVYLMACVQGGKTLELYIELVELYLKLLNHIKFVELYLTPVELYFKTVEL